MGKHTPALLAVLMGTVRALLTPARGRHSTAARRRRSTRVRRYAPAPAPVEAAAPPVPRPVPAPRLAPPRESIPADDITLVRPYYAVHERERERELARVQAEATARLHTWIPQPRPSGDLLADAAEPQPGEFDELAALVRIWQAQRTHERAAVAA